tara:strand:+ start:277 stop:504 length:228 start_codon:yes stop_codon:yes gene_type:complete
MTLIIFPFTLEDISIVVVVHTLAVSLPVLPVTLVTVATAQMQSAMTFYLAVHPLSFITISIRVPVSVLFIELGYG